MSDDTINDEFGDDHNWRTNWIPTPKWTVATVTGAGALGTAYVEAGEWNDTLIIMAIGLAVQRISAYVTPNRPPSQ